MIPKPEGVVIQHLATRALVVAAQDAARAPFIALLKTGDPLDGGGAAPNGRLEGDPLVTVGELPVRFEFDEASSEAEAVRLTAAALAQDQPYALTFADVRADVPAGGPGIIERLWSMDPRMQFLLCSRQPQCDWQPLLQRLGFSPRILIIEQPLLPVQVRQCVRSLAHKWHGERKLREQMDVLEGAVRLRTMNLEHINEELRREIRLRQDTEVELALSHKLEAVGRLAAGIAHEINTPIQFISDSANLLASAFQARANRADAGPGGAGGREQTANYLEDAIPAAIARIVSGTERVAKIVKAMREFAHPGQRTHTFVDLNKVWESTVLIASNEYRYLATVEMQLGPIPAVLCNAGEIGQVFLNLLVNAAHAIDDAGRNAQTGKITIATRLTGRFVEVTVQDNGVGIAADNLPNIYDPFFTTKAVGRGTGQGLAIVRSIVVDRIGGTIDVRSTGRSGTCFAVCLPVAAEGAAA